MNKKSKFSIKARLNSFKHALRGLKIVVKEEDNAKIHLGIGIIMYILSAVLKLKKNGNRCGTFLNWICCSSRTLQYSYRKSMRFCSTK
ncbi:diacylglycerol kinase family protein [Marinifilum fragile]|uniref:diacylglycerol kinase family protein n=1 Tax=Marinifilum fragile TaxID=570161 RepID=UPI0006D24EC5